jgi:hypothetical protein
MSDLFSFRVLSYGKEFLTECSLILMALDTNVNLKLVAKCNFSRVLTVMAQEFATIAQAHEQRLRRANCARWWSRKSMVALISGT